MASYLPTVNNRTTKARCETSPKSTIKTHIKAYITPLNFVRLSTLLIKKSSHKRHATLRTLAVVWALWSFKIFKEQNSCCIQIIYIYIYTYIYIIYICIYYIYVNIYIYIYIYICMYVCLRKLFNPLKAIGNLNFHISDIQSYCNIFSFSG